MTELAYKKKRPGLIEHLLVLLMRILFCLLTASIHIDCVIKVNPFHFQQPVKSQSDMTLHTLIIHSNPVVLHSFRSVFFPLCKPSLFRPLLLFAR